MCRRGGSAKLDSKIQARRNCARPGFDRRQWSGELVQLVWMGAPERLDIDERGAEKYPREDPDEGCPGAWYRTPFVESVLRYWRSRDASGAHQKSRLLEMCTDELVIEAVEMLDAFDDAWHADWERARQARREAASGSG